MNVTVSPGAACLGLDVNVKLTPGVAICVPDGDAIDVGVDSNVEVPAGDDTGEVVADGVTNTASVGEGVTVTGVVISPVKVTNGSGVGTPVVVPVGVICSEVRERNISNDFIAQPLLPGEDWLSVLGLAARAVVALGASALNKIAVINSARRMIPFHSVLTANMIPPTLG